MSEEFEITVNLIPEMLVKRIEAAQKPMALAISPCSYNKDQGSFACRMDFFNACAHLTGTEIPDNKETKLLVKVDDRKVGNLPIGMLTAIACLLFQLPLCGLAFISPTHNWLFIALVIVIPVGLQLLFIPISKRLLKRFVQTIVQNETQD